MKRNDSLWQRLFDLSNSDSFDINNLWNSFATQGENGLEKKPKFLREKVDFAAPIVNKCIEGQSNQLFIGSTRRQIFKLNRLPVILMGSQIDIVDHLRSFACKTLLQPCFTFDSKSVTQKKRKEMDSSTFNKIPKVRWTPGSRNKSKKGTFLSVKNW